MKKLLFLMIFIFITSVLFAKININTATKEELMSLKGLGEKKAEAIIERREKKPFDSIEELLEIKGIGKRFLEKNKDNICVGSDC
ncbi:DNA uptake protein [Deferribacter desulfuricans SSM1]|uniref:DNA uptake protein n=1 Tax=Deferribacter desulfuricans (strain DSM 14783 / JCM 11476 / NBRC 101012 / SSM1) TaxID=639282 RepID=D3PB84_DEFDS|nr:ComEA family DNA-binding protein [Deferribacter desulfuricans]BAI79857.1 DNA uptake protein [Deferribacter desulfuricans SSM1]